MSKEGFRQFHSSGTVVLEVLFCLFVFVFVFFFCCFCLKLKYNQYLDGDIGGVISKDILSYLCSLAVFNSLLHHLISLFFTFLSLLQLYFSLQITNKQIKEEIKIVEPKLSFSSSWIRNKLEIRPSEFGLVIVERGPTDHAKEPSSRRNATQADFLIERAHPA